MKIWKYQLGVTGEQSLFIPRGAEFLSVQIQYDLPCLWAIVDPEAEKESVTVITCGTGHEITENSLKDMRFLGTYQLNGGEFIGHVFVPHE